VSLDHLSEGRLILGVGSGSDMFGEITTFGGPAADKTRAQMLDESLEVLVGLWSGESFAFNGTHFLLRETQFLPRPVQKPRIPIWVAGTWPKKPAFRRPSVQAAGNALNVVLFHRAARMEALEVPAGTEISASLGQMYEEGWETEYTVIEEVPAKKAAPPADDAKIGPSPRLTALAAMPREPHDPDCRETTLKIAVDSVKIQVVRRVEFHTDEYDVQRNRWEKHEPRF
jgi:hypothetical protein